MIEIKNLTKLYGRGKNSEIRAVNNISVSLPSSGMVALFGKSGCGKTTFLNIVGGLDSASGGGVEMCGKRISQSANDARNRDIGYIFQNYYLTKDLTVYENVALALRLCGVTDEQEIERRSLAALRSVGMDKYRKRLPDNLSGGQQQRVAVARAIVKNPKVILADEPTGNLDENNTLLVMDLLKEISKNCLVLLVTHEAELVDLYCDTVIEMSDGQITNTYENERTDGYIGKGKNDIYLGDLERREISGEGMDIEFFGDGESMPHSLRLVCVGGVIYINSGEGIKLRVVDSSTELKFHEGRFEEKKAEIKSQLDHTLTEPLSYKNHSGRMYSFARAFKSGYRSNFGKRKFGRKLLMWVMMLMAIIVVISMAAFGRVFETRRSIENKYNTSTVAVKVDAVSREELLNVLKDAKYDDISVSPGYWNNETGDPTFASNDRLTYTFNVGNFETFSIGTNMSLLYTDTLSTRLPISAMPSKRMLAGKGEITAANEVILSKSLADAAIKSLDLDFVKDYDDLIHCTCSDSSSYGESAESFLIVGIVDDTANAIYMDPTSYARSILGDAFLSYDNIESDKSAPKDGEVYLNNKITWLKYAWGGVDQIEGLVPGKSRITILGKEFLFAGYLSDKDDGSENCQIILNSRDLSDLTSHYGASEIWMESVLWKYSSEAGYYAYMIHSEEPAALSRLLEDKLGDENVTSPEEMFKYYSTISSSDIWGSVRTILICLGALVLCMYFIMRSSLMKDIKEVGICRAIGVSRKNIIYKYFVESITVFIRSIIGGFIIGSFLAIFMMAITGTLLLNYTFGIAIASFVLLFAVTTLCGIIPVSLLLRKTPAQIISKYDI